VNCLYDASYIFIWIQQLDTFYDFTYRRTKLIERVELCIMVLDVFMFV